VRIGADMNVDCLDEKSVMTYVACLCDALHQHSAAAAAATAAAIHRQEVFDQHHIMAFFPE